MDTNSKKNSIIEKLYSCEAFPFICMFFIYIILHMIFFSWCGDDIRFKDKESLDTWEVIIGQNLVWTSRMLVNAVVYILLVGLADFQPIILWGCLDSFMLVLMAWSINKLFKLVYQYESRFFSWIILGNILIFPLRLESSAGWVWTTVSYIWPLAIGVWVFVNYIESLYMPKRKIKIILYSMAVIYSANIEGMSVLLFMAFFSVFLAGIIEKQIRYEGLYYSVLCIGSIIWHAFSPGNTSRLGIEIGTWFPNFEMMTFIDKVELAFSRCLYFFVYNYNSVFLLFSILLLAVTVKLYKDSFYRVISGLPLLVFCIFAIISKQELYSNLTYMQSLITREGTITVYNFSDFISYVPIILGVIVCISIVITIYIINIENVKAFIVVMCILIGGLGSWMIMLFSPTIWGSGDRTFCDLYFIFIFLSIWLCHLLIKADKNMEKYIMWAIWILALTNCFDTIL